MVIWQSCNFFTASEGLPSPGASRFSVCPGGTLENSPGFQPQKCTRCVRDCPKRLICTANFRILRPRQKPSILVGYWRARETPV